ncbi:MAG TPA: CpsB/CapC family capsule biosynthesis tyrosine phosphatase [Terriglobales bacterium]|nr:CpsB/CapC family capsule biosynthesis tyrosine phosphatase [Terriglobales bacterium]
MPATTPPPDAHGRVDTHLHLLPTLDDGPADWEGSLAMAEVAIADGTTHVVVTPHANYQFTFDPAHSAELCALLQEKLNSRLQILLGCELHLTYENVQAVLATPSTYTLNASRYVLVEFPEFFERRSLGGALEQMRGRGLVPVLAHPERNPVFQQHPEALDEYLRLGCLSQVTAASFGGRFGKRAQQFSQELLRGERIHLVASDGHSAEQRSPRLSVAAEFIAEQAGEAVATALCRDNPWAIAQNHERLPYHPPPAEKKKSIFSRFVKA